VLVATKFHVPPAGFVPRPRLVTRLAKGLGRGLTVVCTPAGFGKTTLLGDWARRSRRPTAWLSVDAGDNDPARFWRYISAALDQVRPGWLSGSAPCSMVRNSRRSRRWRPW
jgi:LuxR family maltose regulon positive regulatory protein